MPGPVSAYLEDDHALIDRLLDEAVRNPDSFDRSAFARARARLLRHIGIEEKILLPDAKHRRGGRPLPVAPGHLSPRSARTRSALAIKSRTTCGC